MSNSLHKVLDEEEDLEIELQNLLVGYREMEGLMTKFDDELAYILSTALSNYESDKLYGVTFGTEEFQASVRRKVPNGHVFKAFPIQFTHKNAANMFETMRRNPVRLFLVKIRLVRKL